MQSASIAYNLPFIRNLLMASVITFHSTFEYTAFAGEQWPCTTTRFFSESPPSRLEPDMVGPRVIATREPTGIFSTTLDYSHPFVKAFQESEERIDQVTQRGIWVVIHIDPRRSDDYWFFESTVRAVHVLRQQGTPVHCGVRMFHRDRSDLNRLYSALNDHEIGSPVWVVLREGDVVFAGFTPGGVEKYDCIRQEVGNYESWASAFCLANELRKILGLGQPAPSG